MTLLPGLPQTLVWAPESGSLPPARLEARGLLAGVNPLTFVPLTRVSGLWVEGP